jgi:hypothetical protein
MCEVKISILPAGRIEAASARIRAFSLCSALAGAAQSAEIRVLPDADVLFIQKRITDDILRYARHIRNRGGLVLYDLDDSGKRALDWLKISPSQWQEMLAVADAFTTNTPARQALIEQEFPGAKVRLLPDSIDYGPPTPYRAAPEATPKRLKLLWFGHGSNLGLVAPYLQTLCSLDLDFCIATNAEVLASLQAKLPGVGLVPWSLESFPAFLRTCQLSFLVHQGDVHDRAKSSNKMLASIANGVVPIVSDTPEYARLAKEVGAADSLFASPEQLAAAIRRYATAAARTAYLDAAQPLVYERHGPRAVAQAFLALVADLKRARG